tara:strand:- start:18 stop:545 length:528 start_codon:yes stop_codon:yes gene_type:complete
MAGKLIQVATVTVTSPVASVTLTGIDSDDVYMLAVSNCIPVTNGQDGQLRVTKSGTAQSDSVYDFAFRGTRTDTSFSFLASIGSSKWTYPIGWSTRNTSTEAGVSGNAIIYLYNFNSSSEYSFASVDTVTRYSGGSLGVQGGALHKVASASDGVNFQWASGNIDVGAVFTLYRVV